MASPATRTSAITERRGEARWPNHEYVRGWGVFGLPFDSGHVLALRVFPDNSFTPYRTVWHRDPFGHWSIHADAPRLDIACPRYYGPACDYVGHAKIGISWTGPRSLRVRMDEPRLAWTLTVARSAVLGLLNPASALLPISTWRPPALRRPRELLAGALGLGTLQLAGRMPSGHHGVLMPQRMYLVNRSQAVLDGLDLGNPTRLRDNPTIGAVPLPARGVLAIGQAMWEIRDPEEYQRIRDDLASSATITEARS